MTTWTADKNYKTIWIFTGANTTSSGGSRTEISETIDIDPTNPMVIEEIFNVKVGASSSYDSGYAASGILYKISNVKSGDIIKIYANRTPGENGIYYFGDYDFRDITSDVFPDGLGTESSLKSFALPTIKRCIIFYMNFGSSTYGYIKHSFLNSPASFTPYIESNISGGNTRNMNIYILQNVQSDDIINIYRYSNPSIKIYEY